MQACFKTFHDETEFGGEVAMSRHWRDLRMLVVERRIRQEGIEIEVGQVSSGRCPLLIIGEVLVETMIIIIETESLT